MSVAPAIARSGRGGGDSMKRGERNFARLLEELQGVRRLLILPHDHPDPDALASGWVLRHILRAVGDMEVTVTILPSVIRRSKRRLCWLINSSV